MIHETHKFETFPVGMKVILHSLQRREDLNGADGKILDNSLNSFQVQIGDKKVRGIDVGIFSGIKKTIFFCVDLHSS